MTGISSPGIGSGIDVTKIVPQLVDIERRPIDALSKETATLQAKLSSFGLLQSYAVNIQDSIAKLGKPDFWQQTATSSTDPSAVKVTASTSAGNGNYSVGVSQLAQAQSLASGSYADSTASVGTGTLKIEQGKWNADKTEFTPATPPSQVDIPVPLGQDSLESVRAKINSSNAGVSASIVKDGNGSRLVIRSTETGEERSVRITATADPVTPPNTATLNDLVYDPKNNPTSPMTEKSKAQNAKAVFNGLDVQSATNTFADVTAGVSFSVSKVTLADSPVNLTVGLDKATMKSSINDFVNAYNAINRYVADQTKYDPDKKVGATLQGDRSTLSLQSQLRSVLAANNGGASTQFSRLSDVGLEVQADGSLKVNDTKLSTAMEKMPELAKAFTQTDDVNASNSGFAVRIQALAKSLTNSNGLVSTRSQGLRDSIARNDKQSKVLEDRVASFQDRLLKQYSSLDVTVTKLSALNSYISQQITTWNRNTG